MYLCVICTLYTLYYVHVHMYVHIHTFPEGWGWLQQVPLKRTSKWMADRSRRIYFCSFWVLYHVPKQTYSPSILNYVLFKSKFLNLFTLSHQAHKSLCPCWRTRVKWVIIKVASFDFLTVIALTWLSRRDSPTVRWHAYQEIPLTPTSYTVMFIITINRIHDSF